MPPRNEKKRILTRLSGLGYVTDSALSQILKALDEEGALSKDLEGVSRQNIARGPLLEFDLQTIYGHVLQQMQLPLADGGHYSWWYVHPFAVLNFLVKQ